MKKGELVQGNTNSQAGLQAGPDSAHTSQFLSHFEAFQGFWQLLPALTSPGTLA